MGARFLVLNYFNRVQFPGHGVTATENAADAWKVGALRRSSTHYYTSATPHVAIRIAVDCGSAKPADLLVIDRVHNLDGVPGIKLQYSTDNWVTANDVFTFTFPSTRSPDNTSLSTGARTPEGAYVRSFNPVSARYWGLLIPAMAGFRPRIGGLYLGPSWRPPAISRPVGEDDQAPLAEVITTPWGWEGRTLTVPRRSGTLRIELIDEASYLEAAIHIRDEYVRRPMWIIVDEAKAERAFLARWPIGVRAGFATPADYPYRVIELPYEEYEPAIV
jgi:hypothetical protein